MKQYISHIILSFLIIFIMGSALYAPGGIVLLDYVLTPHAPVRLWDPMIFLILNFFSSTLGYDVVSKGFFVMILVVATLLGVLMARSIALMYAPRYRSILEVLGGVFFLINPFAYERMMVQPTIYLGTLLLGYVVYFLVLSSHRWRYILSGIFGGWALIMMPHASYMLMLIVGLYVVFFTRTKRDILGVVCMMGVTILLNLNWLIAPLFGVSNSASSIASFSSANLEAFRTQALAPLDVWGTNILLYGFWGERYANHYTNVDFLSTLWWVGGFILFAIVIFGFWNIWKGSKKLFTFYCALFTFSLIFGIGIASPLTEGLTRWMVEYIPLWQGYREPQKWIGLVMIVEGVGLIVGPAVLLGRYGRDGFVRYSLVGSIVLLFLIWSPGPLAGYHGQLRTTVYPKEFQEVREMLLHPTIQPPYYPTILVLPWHSYIGCSWMGRSTVANPIMGLMHPLPVIVSDNIEVTDILYTNSTSARSQAIEQFLKQKEISTIREYDISGIMLMKGCANSGNYDWIGGIPSCQKSYSSPAVDLYMCY